MEINPLNSFVPRCLATLLAFGSGMFGLFLLLMMGPAVVFFSIYTPGYIVTAGYFLRIFTRPSLETRRLIWIASILVQGIWLCIGIVGLINSQPCGLSIWWAFATTCSVIALATEQPDDA